eukprot:Skav210207  [mRNA]  locus=scaffold440:5744:6826:- [translate_table: standard]
MTMNASVDLSARSGVQVPVRSVMPQLPGQVPLLYQHALPPPAPVMSASAPVPLTTGPLPNPTLLTNSKGPTKPLEKEHDEESALMMEPEQVEQGESEAEAASGP